MADSKPTRMEICNTEIGDYAHAHTSPETDLLRELSQATLASMDCPQMLTGRVEGRLLKLLVQLSGARTVLEIGTFTGYSALSMAEGLPDDGRLISCELDPSCAAFARRYIERSPHGAKIELRIGAALKTLDGLSGPFDLAFVDADKENYPAYYEAVLDKLRPGGLMLLDNALWSGAVLNPIEASDRGIATTNRIAADDPRVENVLLTVRDGIHLIRKR